MPIADEKGQITVMNPNPTMEDGSDKYMKVMAVDLQGYDKQSKTAASYTNFVDPVNGTTNYVNNKSKKCYESTDFVNPVADITSNNTHCRSVMDNHNQPTGQYIIEKNDGSRYLGYSEDYDTSGLQNVQHVEMNGRKMAICAMDDNDIRVNLKSAGINLNKNYQNKPLDISGSQYDALRSQYKIPEGTKEIFLNVNDNAASFSFKNKDNKMTTVAGGFVGNNDAQPIMKMGKVVGYSCESTSKSQPLKISSKVSLMKNNRSKLKSFWQRT